ncbi:uncharacterized protein A4U43_C01F2840 [Asparagus officinalis]|uniref:Auxin-responsive protein n=1 Tax=Asparagus officinalis TaxID=4686 RepID=A0A5P1FQZ2_ASPOF|nr:auxin-responsive protein IAA6-like [Asparagus officinalis]XP_020271869.1 auxin-responsive protein IAA6-like [Asparagus officinalis]ONK79090.1 uncharacterized protein A4U43_C01F2840 [Asparagus officinalis]
MGEEFRKKSEVCPKLLTLMASKERNWIDAQEEKKLELKLGPPGVDEEDPSVLSLGYFPKASKPTKRGFLDTVAANTECCPSSLHAVASVNAARPNSKSSQARGCRTTSVPVVGWPPIRSFRKNLAGSSSKLTPDESKDEGSETGRKPETCKKGVFVKINMDGIPIGRKVDLEAYDSYDKLSPAVEELFRGLLAVAAQKDLATAEQKKAFTGLLDGTGEYTLVYEDNEGDRMLVGDVPWEMFVSTAKRLRVLKSSELSTLVLGAVSSKRAATEC